MSGVVVGLVSKHMFILLHCMAGTNGISPIFLTTVDVTGGIGLDLKTG
jgi:aconitase B